MDKESLEALLDNIICPICYLAMIPSSRAPMIIPGCGHTICEVCLKKLHDCPFCHKVIDDPVRNVSLLQIIDELEHRNLIPLKLNPPPPANNKLIPKIEPICTFFASGDKCIDQKVYQCRTCGTNENINLCETCAHVCHKGHDVFLVESSNNFSCDCQKISKCKCLLTADVKCTYELTYSVPIDQPMFQCIDCHVIGDDYICQNCAARCHYGHNLKYFGNIKNQVCHCLDQSFCQISSRKPTCSFLLSGKKFIKQPWYHCKTCGLVDIHGCCAICAHYCHKDHDIEYDGVKEACCCCDCTKNLNSKLKILKFGSYDYLTHCTNFGFDHIGQSKEQRMYYCHTCGIADPFGICEACAINCHINHSIEYAGNQNFSCFCFNSCKCQMMNIPILHNNRIKCDRLVLTQEDVSACYTCLLCDKSGKNKLCETCALKKHLNHDIHLIGYMKFDCSENKKVSRKKISYFKPKCSPV